MKKFKVSDKVILKETTEGNNTGIITQIIANVLFVIDIDNIPVEVKCHRRDILCVKKEIPKMS